MINTVPPTSNSTHIREKCFKYNNIGIIIQWLHGTVVKDLTSLVVDSEGVSSNHGKALLLHLKHFFPIGLFAFILTADPLKSLW